MDDQAKEYVVSYLTLRQMIGWCGLLMPIGVRSLAYLFEGIFTTHSISAYYYTGMRDVFVSTLVLVGALLACYRTPSKSDNVVATIAGLSAICIGLFPTNPVFAKVILDSHPCMNEAAKCYFPTGILGPHLLFVTIFFAFSFYLVYFRFPAFTPATPTAQKLTRNRIYKRCGVVMLASFACIGLLAAFNDGASIFWPEAAAVMAFAVAWLVKGRLVLKDPVA